MLDFNGDGQKDIVLLYRSGTQSVIAWFENRSTDQVEYAAIQTLASFDSDVQVKAFLLADLDHDNDLDLITATDIGEHWTIAVQYQDDNVEFGQQMVIDSEQRKVREMNLAVSNANGDADITVGWTKCEGNGSNWGRLFSLQLPTSI